MTTVWRSRRGGGVPLGGIGWGQYTRGVKVHGDGVAWISAMGATQFGEELGVHSCVEPKR